MAPRLPIVIASGNALSSSQADWEQSLVTELIMAPSLDAAIVHSLEQIQPDSTDDLCLQGLKGDFVLLSWSTPASIPDELARLGIDAKLIEDWKSAEKVPGKSVYFLQLNDRVPVCDCIGRLVELLKSRSVATVSLGLTPASAQPMPLPLAGNKTSPPAATNSAKSQSTAPVDAASVSKAKVAPNTAARQNTLANPNTIEDDEDFPHLDTLFAEFDSESL